MARAPRAARGLAPDPPRGARDLRGGGRARRGQALLSLPALPRRPVGLLLAATLSETLGWTTLQTALGWQAYARSHDPLVLGLLGLAEFVPAVLLALPAGSLADRVDRRIVVGVASSAAAAVAGGLALDAALGDTQAWPLYLFALAGGTAQAFASPAFTPLLAASVPAESLARVIALESVTWQSSSIVGPLMGGLLQRLGNPAPYLFAAAACLVSAALVTLLDRRIGVAHVESEADDASLSDALAGVRLIFRNPALLGAVSLDLAAVLFGGATALLPVFARDVLHVGAAGYGLLRAAPGVGAVAVGVLLATRPVHRHVGPMLFGAVAAFGALTVVFALSETFALSLVALAGLAAADMVSVFIRGTLVPLLTPPALRGRVSAVERVFIGGSNELGAFESGVAARLLGAVPAVVLGGLASIAIAVLWMWWFPSLRRVDRFEDVVAEREQVLTSP